MEDWEKQEQFVREKYPDSEWVSQAEFNRRFNELEPTQRNFVDVEYGFCATRLPNGRLLMVTQNV